MHDHRCLTPEREARKPVVLLRGWLALVLAISAGLLSIPSCFEAPSDPDTMAEAKQNLHVIQLALERFAVDYDGVYPADFGLLASESYMPKNPDNPYAPKQGGDENRMQPIPLGQPGQPGDFAYVTKVQNVGGQPKVVGYELYLYGLKREARTSNVAVTAEGVDAVRVIDKLSWGKAGVP
jgi:hypothetical protein